MKPMLKRVEALEGHASAASWIDQFTREEEERLGALLIPHTSDLLLMPFSVARQLQEFGLFEGQEYPESGRLEDLHGPEEAAKLRSELLEYQRELDVSQGR